MKVNIKKLQGGGLLGFTPIINAPTQQQVAPQQSSKTESSEEDYGLLDEEMYKQLVSKGGLVNDVNLFTQQLNSSDDDPYAYLNPKSVRNKLQTVSQINELRRNNELWNKSLETAKSQGGLSEVAVGTSGELYVRDKSGKIKTASAEMVNKNREDYKVLTVSELLNARQYDPQLAFDQSVFRVADNSIGLSEITDHIETIVSNLGTIEQSNEYYRSKEDVVRGFAEANQIKKPTAEQLSGIEEIYKLNNNLSGASEGTYKFKDNTKTQRAHTKEALNYIWSTLPKNKKDKLRAITTLNGGDSSDIQKMLQNAIVIGTDHSESREVSFDKNATEGGSDGSKGGLGKMSPEEIFFSGKLDMNEEFNWNNPGTGKTMSIPITGKSVLFSNGRPTGMVTLGQFNESSTAQLLDVNNVTFGGKQINPWDLDKIVYDKGMSARALMPTNYDGTPNYRMLEQFEEAQKVVKQNPNWTSEDVNEFYADRALPFVKVDGDKNIIPSRFLKPFLIFHAYTTDKVDVTKDNTNINELSNKEGDNVEKMLKPFFDESNLDMPTGFWGTDFYKGIVAYPISEDAPAMVAAMNNNMYSDKITMSDVKSNVNQMRAVPLHQNTSQLLK